MAAIVNKVYSKVCLRGLLNMREKQILTSVIEIQKENWG